MRIFRTSFRVAALASAVSLSTGALAYDVNEAMTKAYNTNPALKAARENLAATDELASQAISGWRPNVSASLEKGRSKNKFGDADSNSFSTDSSRLSIEQPV
ncbi:MAG: TolC family protein, partial [Alphaproteobacteria bacterium]|nr:TolC family protein [Alphaproteobacteria bacterium]